MIFSIENSAFHTSYESKPEGWHALLASSSLADIAAALSNSSTESARVQSIGEQLDPYNLLSLIPLWQKVEIADKSSSPFLARAISILSERLEDAQYKEEYLLRFFFERYPPQTICEYLKREPSPFEHPFFMDAHNVCIAGGVEGDAKYPFPGEGDLLLYYAAKMKHSLSSNFSKQDFYEIKEHIEAHTRDIDLRRKMWELLFYMHVHLDWNEPSAFIKETVAIISSDDEMGLLTPMYVAFLHYSHKICWTGISVTLRYGNSTISLKSPCGFGRLVVICHKMRRNLSQLASCTNWWGNPLSHLWAMKVEEFLYPTTLVANAFFKTFEEYNLPGNFWGATFRYLTEVAVGKRDAPQYVPNEAETLLNIKGDLRLILKQALIHMREKKAPESSIRELASLKAADILLPGHIDELVGFLFERKPIATMTPWIQLNKAFENADYETALPLHELP